MVKNEIKINNVVVSYELIADEGKLLYLTYEIEELGDEAHGAPNAIVPLEIDYESLYIEKEIDILNND